MIGNYLHRRLTTLNLDGHYLNHPQSELFSRFLRLFKKEAILPRLEKLYRWEFVTEVPEDWITSVLHPLLGSKEKKKAMLDGLPR